MSMTEREKLGKQADLCSRMGRFDEMLQLTKQLAQKSTSSKPLNEEERNLLSVAFKLLDKKLITKSLDDEAAVFYYKMKGDYARYIAEVNGDNKGMVDNHITIAENAYKEALARAETGISDTHPLYLGLALNYSVFLHEMKGDQVTAIQVARKCYDQALDEINSVPVVDESRYTECRNLLTLLHENLKIWTNTIKR